MTRQRLLRSGLAHAAAAALAAGVSLACARVEPGQATPGSGGAIGPGSGGAMAGTGGGGGGRDAAVMDLAPGDVNRPCVNLQCQQIACPPGTQTTVSGTIYAPNGKLPLYNVIAYVPNAPLDPFQAGVSCDRCGHVSGHPVASAISNQEGKFKIANVPAGKDIPLVVQVGKWRRKVTIPNVTACQDNVLTDPNLTRLPRNRTEGDLPKIAVTLGTCEHLGCLLPRLGVDPAELGIPTQNRAVSYYSEPMQPALEAPAAGADGPANPPDVTTLWRNEAELSKYDVAIFSCECSEKNGNKGPQAYDAVTRYLAKGGRIFGTDFMYVWYRYSTDPALAGALTVNDVHRAGASPIVIDTTFPKGKALADWMKFVDPTVIYGQIEGQSVFDNFSAAMPVSSQVWASSGATPHPRIVSINTPVGKPSEMQCGRAVHMELHVATEPVLDTGLKFPMNCGTELNDSETALAFLFFDLAACIQDDTKPVEPPVVIQ